MAIEAPSKSELIQQLNTLKEEVSIQRARGDRFKHDYEQLKTFNKAQKDDKLKGSDLKLYYLECVKEIMPNAYVQQLINVVEWLLGDNEPSADEVDAYLKAINGGHHDAPQETVDRVRCGLKAAQKFRSEV